MEQQIKKLVVVSIILIGLAMLTGYQFGQQDKMNELKPIGIVECTGEGIFYSIYAIDLPYIPKDSTCRVVRLFNQAQ